ncbi:uncharacterized protein [Arachis hypogaea]|uniref:uncharacterized protein n=1 Tax=Arachis hypogaea TaxID=3818 RepID=UPI000DEDF76A|nr:uncharacterized protein LOC112785890 [Arachis hypogaea]
MQGVKNYSIHRSAEYQVVESDRLKYHMHCHQASNPSFSILVLQGAVRYRYYFKASYKKVWMVKPKVIAQIYGDWEESYNKVPKLLQALQSCCLGTICDLRAVPYYDGQLLVRDCSMFDKVFWAFPSCVETFKHCNNTRLNIQ